MERPVRIEVMDARALQLVGARELDPLLLSKDALADEWAELTRPRAEFFRE